MYELTLKDMIASAFLLWIGICVLLFAFFSLEQAWQRRQARRRIIINYSKYYGGKK